VRFFSKETLRRRALTVLVRPNVSVAGRGATERGESTSAAHLFSRMTSWALRCCVLALAVPFVLCGSPVTLHTKLGVIQGMSSGGADSFKGIPYAKPPLNELRFAPAQMSGAWEGTFDATKFGAPCLQTPASDPNQFPDPEAPPPAEDCLSINIWRPTAPKTQQKNLPVLVYFFGGGFCIGAGSEMWFDGTTYSSTQDVVVVTFNYRLGPLVRRCLHSFPASPPC
jgi:hypothetical protein